MSDHAFVETALRQLETLDQACLHFLEVDCAKPRDLPAIRAAFRLVDARRAELLNHDLMRLDKLAMEILPGMWGRRFTEAVAGVQAGNVEQLHRLIRHRHAALLHLAKLLRGRASGEPDAAPAASGSPKGGQAEGSRGASGNGRKRTKEPSGDAIKCYQTSIALLGRTQKELAELLTRMLRRPVDQPTVSRWLKQVRSWLKAGNILPDLTADDGAKPKIKPMDPARLDRGDGRRKATRSCRSQKGDMGD